MLDLLAARDAGRRDHGVRGCRLDGGDQAAIAERDRDVVVLALEAERARHPAAPGVDLLDPEARPLEGRDRRGRAHERLLVAVTVQEHLPPVAGKAELEAPRALALEELVEQEGVPRHGPSVVGAKEIHRSEEHTSELQSLAYLVCRLL